MIAIDRDRGVLLLGLNFTSKLDNSYTHQAEQVTGRVRMIVHASVEGCGHVLADTHLGIFLTTGVLRHEIRDIINNTLEQDPLLVIVLASVLEILKGQDWEIGNGSTPLKLGLLLHDLLLNHLKLTLTDLVIGEGLQVRGETKEGAGGDQPFGRVVLVEADRISVVLRELMVEVVVTLTESHEGSDEMVARCMTIIKRSLTEPVSERVDTEGGVVNENQTGDGSKKK